MEEPLHESDWNPYRKNHLLTAARRISELAIRQVADKYGNGGYGAQHEPGTEADLPYHNVEHTIRVRDNAVLAAKAIGLEKYDQALVAIAASAHDVVHGRRQRGENETHSIRWLEKMMQQYEFPAKHIKIGKFAIDGTRVILGGDGWIAVQKAAELSTFPYGRKEWIALCVAVADMADLFSAHGPLLGHALYQEQQGVPFGEVPPMDGLVSFQQREVDFLKTYRFAHPIGESLFGGLRQQVIGHHEAVLNQLQAGEISDWQTLLEFDRAFADKYQD